MFYKKFLFTVTVCMVFSCSSNNSGTFPAEKQLQEGDIILQSIPCGDLCDSIEKSTKIPNLHGKSIELPNFHGISHAGVYTKFEQKDFVIEAYGSVKRTPLNDFIKRSRKHKGRPVIYIVRLKKEYRAMIPFFIKELEKRIGKPYDETFTADNDRYYCSELISDSLLSIGLNIYPRRPMFFGQPYSREFKVFKNYFQKKNMNVPVSEPGTNPAALLILKDFKIIYDFKKGIVE